MQTIARANRVFPGKHSGMIVDYANVFASLEKALAIYGAGKDGKNPVKDKQKLVEELREALDDATASAPTMRWCSRTSRRLAWAAWSACTALKMPSTL
jgi:type I site-specific restriction-modification system R (restriction) subunit